MSRLFEITRRSLVAGFPAVATGLALGLPAGASPSRGSVSLVTASDLDADELARHETHMATAIDAAENADAPFGAIIVDRASGDVLCTGRNRSSEHRIYHGEMDAMITCGLERPDLDWSSTVLYTTGEPCPMCMSAAVWLRIGEVVYATSIASLIEMGMNQIDLTSISVAGAAPFYSGRVVGDVLRERTDPIFADWMAQRSR